MLMNSRTIHFEIIKMMHSISLMSLARKTVIYMTALLEYVDRKCLTNMIIISTMIVNCSV